MFRRREDMVSAATAVLNSAMGQRMLRELEPLPAGNRRVIRCDVQALYDLEASDANGAVRVVTAAAQRAAGHTTTRCTMVVDTYANDFHILIQTFYAQAN